MSRIVSKSTVMAVRRRAHDVCEYCKMPFDPFVTAFEIDHIVPRVQKGDHSLSNLAWACYRCNSKKSCTRAHIDPHTAKAALLFNPRADNWKRHFDMTNGRIIARTAKARATLDLLDMNIEWSVAVRREHYKANPVQ